MKKSFLPAVMIAALMLIALPAAAQDTGTPTSESLSAAYTGKVYSPYAHRGFPERPLWGDSHLHTSLSMDAGLFGNLSILFNRSEFFLGSGMALWWIQL